MNFRFILFIFIIYGLLTVPVKYLTGQEKKPTGKFVPESGLEGKDVAWIPTPQSLVDKMLELAEITPDDFLIDLGSGDGRLVITAAKLGTKSLGIEYNPDLVNFSRKIAEKEGVTELTEFVEADVFEFDFSDASVITMFLLPHINLRLRPKLLNMKPGTRVVSNTFTMQEWLYDGVAEINDRSERWNTAYLWIVPAKVGGQWVIPNGGKIIIKQEFQIITGTLHSNGNEHTITDGRVSGNEISFQIGDSLYNGKVQKERIEGIVTIKGEKKKWTAVR